MKNPYRCLYDAANTSGRSRKLLLLLQSIVESPRVVKLSTQRDENGSARVGEFRTDLSRVRLYSFNPELAKICI